MEHKPSSDPTAQRRLVAELRALESARAELRYLGYGPRTDTWRSHCAAFGRRLADAMAFVKEPV